MTIVAAAPITGSAITPKETATRATATASGSPARNPAITDSRRIARL